jgi:transcription initiation factor TFIIB
MEVSESASCRAPTTYVAPPFQLHAWHSLTLYQKSNHDKGNKSLQAAYSQIATLCDSQNISKPTAETAKLLFRVTDDAKLFKGKSQDAIIAGCIFIACRNHGQQRSFREIFKMTNVSKKEVGRSKSCFPNYI